MAAHHCQCHLNITSTKIRRLLPFFRRPGPCLSVFLQNIRHYNMHRRDRGGGREERGRGGGDSKRPPHLKGKAIGMYYAQKSAARRQENNQRPLGTVLISPERKAHIQYILDSCSNRDLFKANGTYDHVQDSTFKRDFLRVISESIDDKMRKTKAPQPQDCKLDEILLQQQKLKLENNAKYKLMLGKRRNLPSYGMKEEILQMINANQVVVLSGETGCGKTTQVAQFILDDFVERSMGSQCAVLCTQPRRISAVSVAERVADERAEALGNSVGYHIRLERKLPRERGSITYCTTGIVLKLMENDVTLSNISHLILDEIHERDVLSDFILALIKKIIVKRPDLKVILMSATLNSEKFSKYYNDCPHLNIPGFTYPVKEYFLEDVLEKTGFVYEPFRGRVQKDFSDFVEPHVRLLESQRKYSRNVCVQLRNPNSEQVNLDLIVQLILHICEKEQDQGAILVFLTGFAEISTLIQKLQHTLLPSHRYLIFPLHSLMPTIEQKAIFESPPAGVRKVIVATNIAETSITIDDVVFVIDCGRIKLSNFDVDSNTATLNAEWVALANAAQRKGRAGRVKAGVCYHLYSKAREMVLEQYQKPEILRKRLEDVILVAKILQLGQVEEFFGELIDKPDPQAVTLALNLLKMMDALTATETLTPLGYHLAKLPMAPQMGKMILFGAMFSCLDPILSIAATLDFKDPFQLPIGKEQEVNKIKVELAGGVQSDHILAYEVLQLFENAPNPKQFCWRHFLSFPTMRLLLDMKRQFMEYLCEMKFVAKRDCKAPEYNTNSHNASLVKAIVCAGLYPNISFTKEQGKAPVWTPDMKKLKIHPKSILCEERYFHTSILVYYRKIKSTSDFIHDATLIQPLPVIFFGHNFTQIEDHGHNLIAINDKLRFKCTPSTANVVKELRDRFNGFIEYKIAHPGPVQWSDDNDETKILSVIMDLITCEDRAEFDDGAFEDFD